MPNNHFPTIAPMQREQYLELEKKVAGNNAMVSQTTTDVQAGFQLGVQHVLQILRNGFVSGR